MKPNKIIYLTAENDGTPDQYWQVNQTPEEAAPEPLQKRKVYVYELKEVKTVETIVRVK